MTSFPVPDSPVMSTVVSDGATRPTSRRAPFQERDTPATRLPLRDASSRCLFREPLVGKHQGDTVRETDDDLRVLHAEPRGLAMEEAEAAPDLAGQPDRNADPGPEARGDDEALALGVGTELGRNVVDDLVIDAPRELFLGEMDGIRGDLALRFPRGRGNPNRPRAHVDLGQAHQIMRQDVLHPVGDRLEDVPDVEGLGQGPEQDLDPIETVPAAALDVPEPPVLHGGAQQRGDRPHHFLVLVGEIVRHVRRKPHAAAKGRGGAERLPHRRPHTALESFGIEVERRIELQPGVVDPGIGPGARTHPRRPRGQRDRLGALGSLAGKRAGVEDGVVPVDETDHAHVVEGDELADGGRDPVEHVLELQGLRGDLGDLGQDVGYGLCVDGWFRNGHGALMDRRYTVEF